jgi:trehalose/maltose transport system substrate-binding protein
MRFFEGEANLGNGILRVYQEQWFPFAALPATLARFTAETGIRTELDWDPVGVGTIEHMFARMIGSFTSERPDFDVICTDEIILRDMARRGGVVDLAPRMAAEGMTLDHVTEATRAAVTREGAVLGLPVVNVASMLLCRRDLLDRYRLPLPADWDELLAVAGELQTAVRRDEGRDFWGFETRGAGGGGHAVWTIGSFTGSCGARWLAAEDRLATFTDRHLRALETYLRLIREVCPPDQAEISFVEMRRDYAAGRVGMIMDVGMEYAHVLAQGGALAENSVVAMVPAGPAGRAPNLYSPPWAIPARSDMVDEAWELVKFLASDTQLETDGLTANAVETASLPVLYGRSFDRHFRPDLLAAVRGSRAVAREERPLSDIGIAGCAVVGEAVHAAVKGEADAAATLERIAAGLRRLLEQRGRT